MSRASKQPAPRRASNATPDRQAARHTPRRAKPPSTARRIAEWVAPLLVFALTFGVLYVFVARAFVVPSASMEHTFDIGDRIVAQKVIAPQRGDAIVFKDTAGWMPGNDNYLTKRIIGLPGDHVVCCTAHGNLSVNGTEITESYLPQGTRPSEFPFDVVVPAGRLFVMGDNRRVSADSRCHLALGNDAFVPQTDVVGSVPLVVFPFNHAKLVPNSSQLASLPVPTEAPRLLVLNGKAPVC